MDKKIEPLSLTDKINGDKIIGWFDEQARWKNNYIFKDNYYPKTNDNILIASRLSNDYYAEYSKYEYIESWDWLMPVVLQVQKIFNITVTIEDKETTWKALVKLIKQYNLDIGLVY